MNEQNIFFNIIKTLVFAIQAVGSKLYIIPKSNITYVLVLFKLGDYSFFENDL